MKRLPRLPLVEDSAYAAQLGTHPTSCGIVGDLESSTSIFDQGGQACCVTESLGKLSFACKTKGSSCSGMSVPCSDQADCGGKICCAAYSNVKGDYESVACQDTCSENNSFITELRLCDPQAAVDECKDAGLACKASQVIDLSAKGIR